MHNLIGCFIFLAIQLSVNWVHIDLMIDKSNWVGAVLGISQSSFEIFHKKITHQETFRCSRW